MYVFNLSRLLILGVLCVFTLALFLTVNEYEDSGKELLINGRFQQGLTGWTVGKGDVSINNEGEPSIQLHSGNRKNIVAISQPIADSLKHQWLKLTGEMRTERVIQGLMDWQTARIILIGIDINGKAITGVPHVLASAKGDTSWQQFQAVFPVDNASKETYVIAQLVQAPGTLYIRNLSLVPVTKRAEFDWLQFGMAATWAIVLLYIAYPFLFTIHWSARNILTSCLLIFFMLGVLAPDSSKQIINELVRPIFSWVWTRVNIGEVGLNADTSVEYVKYTIAGIAVSPYKIGHYLAFFAITIMLSWHRLYGRAGFFIVGFLLSIAVISEILQFLIDGREPRMKDVFVDVAGIISGAFVVIFLQKCLLSNTNVRGST